MNNFSMITPAMRDNPYPYYAMARNMAPVIYNDAMGMWNVFRYEDVRAVLRNNTVFSSDATKVYLDAPRDRQSILTMDPPRHTQLRGLINQAFTPRRVAELEPRITDIANELLDAVLSTGSLDIVEHLSYPLPVIIIAELLGVPPEDRAVFKKWSDEIVANLGVDFRRAGPPESLLKTQDEFVAYFEVQIERHRQHPSNDLIDALLRAEIDGQKLTADELLAFCILLLVAGNETTTNLIGNSVRCLLDHPAEQTRVREDLSLIPNAIEEVLRFRPPVQATVRFALEDVEVGGKTIQKGQGAIVWLAAANRDPAEFPDPDRFDVRRANAKSHLTFGLGIHFCLGAPLARLEAKIALETLLRRVPDFRRLDDRALEPVDGFIMHGVKQLPVVFDPARTVAAV